MPNLVVLCHIWQSQSISANPHAIPSIPVGRTGEYVLAFGSVAHIARGVGTHMSLNRRSFVEGAASAFGLAATAGSGWTQVVSPGLGIPPTAAGKAFAKAIGEKIWSALPP